MLDGWPWSDKDAHGRDWSSRRVVVRRGQPRNNDDLFLLSPWASGGTDKRSLSVDSRLPALEEEKGTVPFLIRSLFLIGNNYTVDKVVKGIAGFPGTGFASVVIM